MAKLILTALIESENPGHTTIGVWQNGGKAGVLGVQTEHGRRVAGLLNNVTELYAALKALEYQLDGGTDELTNLFMTSGARAVISKVEGKS